MSLERFIVRAPLLVGLSACLWLAAALDAHLIAQDAPATPTYGARARVREEPRDPPPATEAETAALQEDLGASFSIAESLPGVVPVFSGVPYLIVRGATPSGTATYYDGVQIPALYHIALGPSLISPYLLGQIDFHPGVAPARYGRHTGGALVANPARRLGGDTPRRELELSLLDSYGYLYAPEIDTAVAWRVGDPALLMNLLDLNATLKYFDYQIRHESSIGANTRLVLLGFGAGDQLGDRTAPEDDISMTFHRWVARVTRRFERAQFGSQIVVGYDASTLGRQVDGDGVHITPSLWFEERTGGVRYRVGADMLATRADLRYREGVRSRGPTIAGADNTGLNVEGLLAEQPYTSYPTRSSGGIYGELSFEPLDRVSLNLGARADAWLAGSETEFAVSPSLRLGYAVTPELTLHTAVALAHQAHGSPLPLPSLADVSLSPGLEKAVQSEVGVTWKLPADVQLEAAYFHHWFSDVVYLELVLDCEGNTDPRTARTAGTARNLASICRDPTLPTGDGRTHGFELYLKRNLTERISGFVSYTLAFADAVARDGTRFTPQSDVRHLANAVLHFDLGAGFALGMRLHYRTGKMASNTLPTLPPRRVETRLPSFFRADLRASYSWAVSFGRLEASIGVQNLTASREATHRDCIQDPFGEVTADSFPALCSIHYQPAILLPNLGIRAEM